MAESQAPLLKLHQIFPYLKDHLLVGNDADSLIIKPFIWTYNGDLIRQILGKCPMCLEKKELVRSHLVPRAVYEYCSPEGFSPVRVGNGVVMPTDRQLQDYLLCLVCEDILSKYGETWLTPKLATWKGPFPLYDLIVSGPAEYQEADGGLYFAARNPQIDVEKLTHFGMGIFWKAAVHPWRGNTTEPMIGLGPSADPIRTWLRGENGFPRNVCLELIVSPSHCAQIIINYPQETVRTAWRSFLFSIPGVTYILNVGNQIEQERRALCLHKNQDHPILVSAEVTRKIEQKNANHFHESRKTQRYLAARAKHKKPS